MPFEEELGDALRRTSDDFRGDGRQLAAGGLARGRALRRRRTAAIGGALAVALVGVGGFALSGVMSPDSGTAAGPAARPGNPDDVTTKAADPVSAQEMIKLLSERLPKGTISGETGRGTKAEKGLSAPYAQVVYDDGKGPAAVSVSVSLRGATPACPDPAYVPGVDCALSRLDDGGVLMVTKGYEYPDRREDTKLWHATLATAGGYQVEVSEWNAPAEKGAGVSRTDPPLTADQLRTLVRDGVWQRVAAAIEDTRRPGAAARPARTAPPDPSAAAIRKTLRRLLPEGLRVQDGQAAGNGGGYARVTADDGEGASLVEVNVQNWGDDIPKELYEKATTLPDGTRVVVTQGPAEKGGSGTVAWTVDTMRPDGLRVVVSELNAAGYRQSPTRTEPVVPIGELRELALGDAWEKLGR